MRVSKGEFTELAVKILRNKMTHCFGKTELNLSFAPQC
jgi:hypothetical protein